MISIMDSAQQRTRAAFHRASARQGVRLSCTEVVPFSIGYKNAIDWVQQRRRGSSYHRQILGLRRRPQWCLSLAPLPCCSGSVWHRLQNSQDQIKSSVAWQASFTGACQSQWSTWSSSLPLQFGMPIDKWPCCPPRRINGFFLLPQNEVIDLCCLGARPRRSCSDPMCSTLPPSLHFQGGMLPSTSRNSSFLQRPACLD